MRWVSFTIALLIGIGGLYEAVAVVHPAVPTISRIIQGWRDNGQGTLAFAIAVGCVVFLQSAILWLWRHFRRDKRSSL